MTGGESCASKEELLENISELFLKYGLRSPSMDDICSHLKISKKTLYQLFSNKDDVVEQVLLHQRNSNRNQRYLTELWQHNAIEIMVLIRDHIIAGLKSRRPANLFDLKKYHPDIYQRINQKDQMFIYNLLLEVMERGVCEGYFRADINRPVQVYLFVKQMIFLGEPEMISGIKYPLDVIVSTIVENMIRSFATPKGTDEMEKIFNKQQK